MTIEEWAKDFKSYVNELDIPRDDYKGIMEYIDDAPALLKEQEAVKPITEHHLFLCPVCKNTLFREQKFCHECGKRIDWEGR